MVADATQQRTFTGADIAGILADLSARLDECGRRGSPIALMLLDGVWERAI